MKGEDFYQDIEEEKMRAKSNLKILRREIVETKRYTASMEEQSGLMEKGGGFSLWPKPTLHPPIPNDVHVNPTTLQLHPCVFCNRSYPYYDTVIASYKHIYHIFVQQLWRKFTTSALGVMRFTTFIGGRVSAFRVHIQGWKKRRLGLN